jgi:hypothetical protein
MLSKIDLQHFQIYINCDIPTAGLRYFLKIATVYVSLSLTLFLMNILSYRRISASLQRYACIDPKVPTFQPLRAERSS